MEAEEMDMNREYVIEAGTEVHAGTYVRNGWEVFKSRPGEFVAFTLITVAASSMANFLFPKLGGLLTVLLSAPLGVGYFIAYAKLKKGEAFQFGDFFLGFRYWGQLVLTSIVVSLMVIVGLVFLVVPGIYLGVAYSFAAILVVDHELDFWGAMEASRKIISAIWFPFFVFMLLLLGLFLLGALALLVGLLVAIPVMYCAMAAAYDDIVGIRSDTF